MSLDPTHHDANIAKKHEIAHVVSSRKRKLIELFAVTTSTEPIPKPRPHLHEPQIPALTTFLRLNDLEKGRYFQDATLPSRTFYASPFINTQHGAKSQIKTALHPAQPASETVDALGGHDDIVDAPQTENASKTIGTAKEQDDLARSARIRAESPTTGQAETRMHPRDVDRPRTVMRLSGVVVGGQVRHRANSPRVALQPDHSPGRISVVKPSRPASPPYSPGTEPTRTAHTAHEDSASRLPPDESANVLTPRKEDHDGIPPSSSVSPTGTSASSSVTVLSNAKSSQMDGRHHPLAPRFRAAETDLLPLSTKDLHVPDTPAPQPLSAAVRLDADHPSPPLSSSGSAIGEKPILVGELVGNDGTPRTDAVYNVENTMQASDVNGPTQNTIANELSEVNTSSPNVRPALSPQSLSSPCRQHSPAKHGSDINPTKDDITLTIPKMDDTAGMPQVNGALPVELPDLPASLPEASPVKTPLQHNDHGDSIAPMDIVEPASVFQNVESTFAPSLRKLQPQSTHRIRKCRSRRKYQAQRVVLCRTFDDRHHETTRRLYKGQGYTNTRSQSYFKPLYRSQAVDAENMKGLDMLLKDAPKFVTTTDFMTGICEEQDIRILDRTRHMQSTGRWSLRQPKPSPEPRSSGSYWDGLLKSTQWLQSDFREERKLKLIAAKMLAEWCAEWVTAGHSRRSSLQVTRNSKLMQLHHQHVRMPYVSRHFADPTSYEGVVPWILGETKTNLEFPSVMADPTAFGTGKLGLSETILQKIPSYVSDFTQTSFTALGEEEDADSGRDPQSTNEQKPTQFPEPAEPPESQMDESYKGPVLPPEDTSCALFNPESRPLRTRLNGPWAFKPPTAPMPSQAFYEHRMPSQWNWEDDQLLKQYTKDFPSNWSLIADRMAPRSSFTSYVERRTSWECYERLLAMEGPPADAQARQYLRHFPYRIERAREAFDKHQATIREQTEQHARAAGQPVPPLPQKRFPTPMRVDRKQNKRFLAVLDGARKTARKREQNLLKQQNLPQQEGPPQKPVPARIQPTHTPQYFSKLKHDNELKEQERNQTLRDQQRQMMEAQRRQLAGQQAHLAGGMGQQLRNRSANGQVAATGLVGGPVPNQARPQPQSALPMSLPNGLPANAQPPMNGRPQANMQGQQRLAPHVNGQPGPNQANVTRMMHEMQQRAFQEMQNQQRQQHASHGMQVQFGGRSPNVTNMNSASNPSMMGAFNNNNLNLSAHDGATNLGGTLQGQNGTASHSSPHLPQHLPATPQAQVQQTYSQPQSLSSGHVPPIVNFQHQIRNSNPNMSPQEVRHHATEQLKTMMLLSRQNAINAATGAHPQAHALMGGGGPQSPFPPGHQHQSGGNQQVLQQQNQYPQNGMLRSSSNHSAQGHGASPVNAVAMLATPQQVQPGQQPQNQYSAQLRQQMYAQQQRQHQMGHSGGGGGALVPGRSGSPPNVIVSPAMGIAMPAFQGGGVHRTPTPVGVGMSGGGMGAQGQSMRPPSRSTGGIEAAQFNGAAQSQQQQQQQQRPTPSPRPPSAQGFV